MSRPLSSDLLRAINADHHIRAPGVASPPPASETFAQFTARMERDALDPIKFAEARDILLNPASSELAIMAACDTLALSDKPMDIIEVDRRCNLLWQAGVAAARASDVPVLDFAPPPPPKREPWILPDERPDQWGIIERVKSPGVWGWLILFTGMFWAFLALSGPLAWVAVYLGWWKP